MKFNMKSKTPSKKKKKILSRCKQATAMSVFIPLNKYVLVNKICLQISINKIK